MTYERATLHPEAWTRRMLIDKTATPMRRFRAALGSTVFFALAPGIVAGVVPWWLTRWETPEPIPTWANPVVRITGAVLIVSGLAALTQAFVRFVTEGVGTPAPVAPTERLVVGGLYRHVRNPMYLAVIAVIIGQAFALGRASLLVYAAIIATAMAAFVYGYEEPALSRRYGAPYDAYRRAVPGWWPRSRPWEGDE